MDDFKVPNLPTVSPAKVEKKPIVEDEKPEFKIAEEMQPKQSNPSQSSNICPYKIPPWSGLPKDSEVNYKFEVLKSGQIIEEIILQKQAVWKFGRLLENDIVFLHPTASRFHAVLQYRPQKEKADGPAEGWYVYDLESTHGTFLNKQRIPPRVFIRIRVGHMLRFGASTRSFILQGPVEDEEPESELSVTELREQRLQQQQTAEEIKQKAKEAAIESLRNEGVNWGMGEDADEETDLTHNPFASTNNEELFLDDPKRTLRAYFEREDLQLEYKCDEMSAGSFVCRVELPIDDANGRPIVAEVVHKGKKKECVAQCALEACRILDRHGVLRQANREPLRRRPKPKDSDSDDDEFWDRTGDIEKRKQRKANTDSSVTLTYEELIKQEAEAAGHLRKVEDDIASYQEKQKKLKEQAQAQEGADLDSFMDNLNEDVTQLDKTEIKKFRLEQQRLNNELQKLRRLIKLAKPYELPGIFSEKASLEVTNKSTSLKRQLPMIGKRNQFSKFKVVKLPEKPKSSVENKNLASDEEEMEDEENEVKQQEIHEMTSSKRESEESKEITKEKLKDTKEPITATQIPAPVLLSNEEQDLTRVEEKKIDDAKEVIDSDDTKTIPNESGDNSKKRLRFRQRQRTKRQDVDIDELEDHESTEKYAKWVPPPNQTGDGFTTLNEKYGY